MEERIGQGRSGFALLVGFAGWLVPGAGYFLVREKMRGLIIFITIAATFGVGLYVGSIGAVDRWKEPLWYIAQMMNSPAVAIIGYITAGGAYPVYGRPAEVGQIYTSIAGLLNLLCIINAMYWAYAGKPTPESG